MERDAELLHLTLVLLSRLHLCTLLQHHCKQFLPSFTQATPMCLHTQAHSSFLLKKPFWRVSTALALFHALWTGEEALFEGPWGTAELGELWTKCHVSGCRPTLLLGHHFLVLLFHDVDGSFHATYEMRSLDQVRGVGTVPAHFYSYPQQK